MRISPGVAAEVERDAAALLVDAVEDRARTADTRRRSTAVGRVHHDQVGGSLRTTIGNSSDALGVALARR